MFLTCDLKLPLIQKLLVTDASFVHLMFLAAGILGMKYKITIFPHVKNKQKH